MANILYGVNGEGSGHSTRSKEIIQHLQQQGHTVHVASFDRGLRNLSADFDVTEIYGLRLAYVQNKVRYGKTVVRNLFSAPGAVRSIRQLMRLSDEWAIQLVITDFEPLTARVARHKRLPLISIDNQHCLTHAQITYPRQCRNEAAAAKLVTRLMVPRADAVLITSFFTAPLRREACLFPPILRSEVLQTKASEGEHVLVYVTAPSQQLAALLKQVNQTFVCYGFGRTGQEGNLLFKAPTMPGFLSDLASCKSVIANCGFSLISEALHLGKPFLAWPVQRQFEQVFNAYYIGETGYGAYWDDLNKERIESFLFNHDTYKHKLATYPRTDNAAILAKVDELIATYAC
jgi:uncharacterized protein (TIGR00661 family)